MGLTQLQAEYETRLAAAHKWLYLAAETADLLQDYGAAEDLIEIMRHIHQLTEDSLRGKKQPRRQLSVLDSNRT